MLDLENHTGLVLAAAFAVHTALGPGLLESAYEVCLEHELKKRGAEVVRQRILPIVYDGRMVSTGYRTDLIVNNEVIVEIKSVKSVLPVHRAQLLTYLKLADHRVGLLLNFNVVSLKDGITRMVHTI